MHFEFRGVHVPHGMRESGGLPSDRLHDSGMLVTGCSDSEGGRQVEEDVSVCVAHIRPPRFAPKHWPTVVRQGHVARLD
jgi:hypothetical protein